MFHLLCTIFGAYKFTDATEAASDSRIEVVFDGVVGSVLSY